MDRANPEKSRPSRKGKRTKTNRIGRIENFSKVPQHAGRITRQNLERVQMGSPKRRQSSRRFVVRRQLSRLNWMHPLADFSITLYRNFFYRLEGLCKTQAKSDEAINLMGQLLGVTPAGIGFQGGSTCPSRPHSRLHRVRKGALSDSSRVALWSSGGGPRQPKCVSRFAQHAREPNDWSYRSRQAVLRTRRGALLPFR